MRISFTLAIILMSFAVVGTAQRKTDWEDMNLKGKVKHIIVREYDMSDESETDKTPRFQYFFNNKGFKTEEIEKEGFERKSNASFKRNANGELVEEKTRFVKGTSNHKFKYNEKTRTLTVEHFVANNVLIARDTRKYDEKGNMVERFVVNVVNKKETVAAESYWRTYDDNGRLIEEKQRIGVTEQRIVFTYDDNGNLIEQIAYRPEDNAIISRTTFKHDDRGSVIELTLHYKDNPPKTTTYYYSYDDKGNWVEQREQEGGITKILTLREIEYFK